VGAEDGELVVVVEEAVSPKEREQVLHEAREGKPRCSAELSALVGGQARRKQGTISTASSRPPKQTGWCPQ
jgi:hypothetical protein